MSGTDLRELVAGTADGTTGEHGDSSVARGRVGDGG